MVGGVIDIFLIIGMVSMVRILYSVAESVTSFIKGLTLMMQKSSTVSYLLYVFLEFS